MPDGQRHDPTSAPAFRHLPLNVETKEVRLLQLAPDNGNEGQVRARLQHFQLPEAPAFKALSYTWGPVHPLRPIYIGSDVFWVRPNLAAFLDTIIRDPQSGTDWLWIDQVCIRQDDVTERNHQVRQMAEIYRSASEVIVWLGPGTDESPLLPKGATELQTELSSWSNPGARALIQLLRCEYWTRTWIVQEFILATSVVLYWGTAKFSFDDLDTITTIGSERIRLRHCHAHALMPMANQITALASRRKIRQTDGFIIENWKDALTLTSSTQCQDPRDRIYALLGLVDPQIAVTPNYAASMDDIFVDVMVSVPVQLKHTSTENYNKDLVIFPATYEQWNEMTTFLTTKALVSRVLGLGNRPLDTLVPSWQDIAHDPREAMSGWLYRDRLYELPRMIINNGAPDGHISQADLHDDLFGDARVDNTDLEFPKPVPVVFDDNLSRNVLGNYFVEFDDPVDLGGDREDVRQILVLKIPSRRRLKNVRVNFTSPFSFPIRRAVG